MNRSLYSRKATLSLKITEFEVPPMQDMLIIGRKAPVGPEAVRRMAEALSPDQFVVVKLEHSKIEAVLVRKTIFEMMNQDILMAIVLEEAEGLISETMVLRSELKVSISVQREVDLS